MQANTIEMGECNGYTGSRETSKGDVEVGYRQENMAV